MPFFESLTFAETMIVILCGLGVLHLILLLVLIGRSARKNRASGASAMPVQTAPQGAEGIPDEIVAVIMAALQATMDSEGSGGYAIRSIRRVPAWNNAARNEQQKRLV